MKIINIAEKAFVLFFRLSQIYFKTLFGLKSNIFTQEIIIEENTKRDKFKKYYIFKIQHS